MSFGSHGGEDYYVQANFDEVERILERDIPSDLRPLFRAELDAAAPYVKDREGALLARIQMAMLYIAKGDLKRLRQARELADLDWRDVLMSAEYPSTPRPGVKETPEQKAARQKADRDAVARWRSRE